MEVFSFSPTFVQRISGLEEDFIFNYNSPTIGKLIRNKKFRIFSPERKCMSTFYY